MTTYVWFCTAGFSWLKLNSAAVKTYATERKHMRNSRIVQFYGDSMSLTCKISYNHLNRSDTTKRSMVGKLQQTMFAFLPTKKKHSSIICSFRRSGTMFLNRLKLVKSLSHCDSNNGINVSHKPIDESRSNKRNDCNINSNSNSDNTDKPVKRANKTLMKATIKKNTTKY